MLFSTLIFSIVTYAVVSTAQDIRDDVRRFAVANNIVAARMYPRLTKGNSYNVFFCPGSLMTGMGMLLVGARGRTQTELYSVLGYEAAGLPNNKVPDTFYFTYTRQIPEDRELVNYTLNCADEVLVTKKAPLYNKYLRYVQERYVATIKNDDFRYSQNVARDINNFVSSHTNGKIKTIINGVSPSTSALIIDAVAFRGKWDIPFPSVLTAPQLFYSQSGQQSVPFMRVTNRFPYTDTFDYQAVFLPYVGRNFGLLIILPWLRDGLPNLENTMTVDTILSVRKQLRYRDANVTIPKFTLTYSKDFRPDFESLGAKSAYDGSGDFSGASSANSNLAVSGPFHKAYLEVDEGDQRRIRPDYVPNPKPVRFTADHPFLMAVIDLRIDLILFIGCIKNL